MLQRRSGWSDLLKFGDNDLLPVLLFLALVILLCSAVPHSFELIPSGD